MALKLKTDLHAKIVKCAARYSQRQLQTILDESQPRISDLLRGKMSKFSLEMFVIYAEKLGLHTGIKTKRARSRCGRCRSYHKSRWLCSQAKLTLDEHNPLTTPRRWCIIRTVLAESAALNIPRCSSDFALLS